MSQNAKDDMPDPARGTRDRAEAGQRARRRVLGDQLRAYYDSVTSEPVPDTLTELMAALARKSAAAQQPGDETEDTAEDGASGRDGNDDRA
jgi:hypothetical protein